MVAAPAKRTLIILLLGATGLSGGLLNVGILSLGDLNPTSGHDSEFVMARGYPHPWLVVETQQHKLGVTAKRIATKTLLMSCFFWLAVSTVTLGGGRALLRSFGSATSDLRYSVALRCFAALTTALCAASYGHLFAGEAEYPCLLAGTCVSLLSPLFLVRSPAETSRRRSIVVLLFLAGLSLAASSFGGFGLLSLPFVAVFLLACLAISHALLYWLAPAIDAAPPNFAQAAESVRAHMKGHR